MSIRQNIEIIYNRIFDAAAGSGNNGSDIIVVCVTKNRLIEEIYQALDAGVTHIGENRVQEAQNKYVALSEYARDTDSPLNLHMVGHLQTNKVNRALGIFDLIQSVDSLKIAQKINEVSKEEKVNTDILVEVNASGEESKLGVSCEQAIYLLEEICRLENISVRGLMTMAPLTSDKEEARSCFRKLRQLRDQVNEVINPFFGQRIKMDFLSMGMSQDYETAVEEGANMLRIGTAVFEGVS